MSVCPIKNSNIDKTKYIKKYINTKVDRDQIIPFGFTSSIDRDGKTEIYVHGKRNIEKNLPFEPNSIYRMASQSKFMGTVGFLKLIDQGKITWDTPVSQYLPEYSISNMCVIEPYEPSGYDIELENPIITTEGSNVIHIIHHNHPFDNNSVIGIEKNGSLGVAETRMPNINGISGFQVFNVFIPTNITKDGYDIVVHDEATLSGITGKKVKVVQLEDGVKRSICFSPDKYMVNPKVQTYYYREVPLKREITVLDVMTHGLGWGYYSSSMLYMCFGYSEDQTKLNIQAGIWNELGIPVGVPNSYYKCDINCWARTAAKVPLLFQPGENWSYGPQIALLGSLIEQIDGRPVEKYMREELWQPLGMKDTNFFIQDHDQDKKDRLCQLYINVPKIVIKFYGTDLPFPAVYEAQTCTYEGPRCLCFMDSGMFTTVNDYLKFLKLFINNGLSDNGDRILSKHMIKAIGSFHTNYNVSNLTSVEAYSAGMSVPLPKGTVSEINREKLLNGIKWGLGVGTIQGCKGNPYLSDEESEKNMSAITWAGVLGSRFLIDFCAGVAYNAGTNVVGPPAGIFDSDLIELNYKTLTKEEIKHMLSDLIF